jgi:cytochrome c553
VGAKLSREFIYESLTQPSAFIYKQYQYSPPKAFGAQMPPINKPPIGLSENELLAVIAFVQSTGGQEYVTVDPSELVKPAEAVIMVSGDPNQGRAVFGKLGCGNCHGETKSQSKAKEVSDLLPKSQQENAIFLMGALQETTTSDHKGFSARLSVKDLNDLTAYLGQFKTVSEDM